MRTQTAGFSISALMHGAFGLLLYSLATLAPEARPPVAIDLSLLAGPSATPATISAPAPRTAAITPPRPAEVSEVVKLPAPVMEAVLEEEESSPPINEIQVTGSPTVPRPIVQSAIAASPAAGPVAGKGIAAPAGPSGSGQTLTPEEQWRQEHFNFIKEAIRKNMTYPVIARKNGWQGRVLVSFVICLDGRVEDIRIEKSSGFALLDKNAVTIIKQTSPFPSPPVRATLIVPIDFTLG